jgi:hypothetical protein
MDPGGRFSASDLEPSASERDAARRSIVDRTAATIAVIAAGAWAGGMVALGACAAPFVFSRTPAPFSGDAMGAAFARFDQIAFGAAVAILAAEIARTWAGRRRARTTAARARRFIGMLLAAFAVYGGLVLTPAINQMHQAGVRRGVGPEGEALEHTHKRAEFAGKLEVVLTLALIGLHIFTLPTRRPEDDDEEDAPAPLPPGPAA